MRRVDFSSTRGQETMYVMYVGMYVMGSMRAVGNRVFASQAVE